MNGLKIKVIIVIVFNVLAVGVWFGLHSYTQSARLAGNTTYTEIPSGNERVLVAEIAQQEAALAEKSEKEHSDIAQETAPREVAEVTRTQGAVAGMTTETPSVPVERVSTESTSAIDTQLSVQEVLFFPQAPSGEWSDPRFQHACEEASMSMAMAWAQDTSLTRQQYTKEIIDITTFETKKFGAFVFDTSLDDVAQVVREYYQYDNIEVVGDIVPEDIIYALETGSVVIVPVDGRRLHNPYFTAPGPTEHMVVIIGYDADTQEFIVNDPGTRHGEKYRYNKGILYKALYNYATGNHRPIINQVKPMLVIHKQ